MDQFWENRRLCRLTVVKASIKNASMPDTEVRDYQTNLGRIEGIEEK